MKKGVAGLIALILVMVLPMTISAQGSEEDNGVITIGAAMSSFADKGQTYLQEGIRNFDAEHDDLTIVMTDAKDDAAVQLNQVETLLTKGVSAIVIVPVDISALEPIFAKVKEDNVKLIIANRMPDEKYNDLYDVYTGSESIKAGILQAEWVAEALQPDGGKVGIIMGTLGQEASRKRTEGVEQVFAEYDNIEVVESAVGKWDRALGMTITENWLQRDEPLAAICSNNDEMAIGAILATQGAGIKDSDIIIAGIDATPDALVYLGEGLDVTVYQNMIAQGYNGAKAAYDLVKGNEVEKWNWIPFEIVTEENMENYK